MNELQFHAFRAVMLTGTVSAAAELLGRSQPAVSRLLSNLERDLGVSLFERRKGLVVPNSAAHQLLDEVERANVALESLRSFANRLSQGEGGEISIGIMPALGTNFMPQVLAAFREVWPQTRVRLSVHMSATVEDWAASQQVDLGIAEMPFKRSGFDTELFSSLPYIAAVPAGHHLATRKCLRPRDLENESVIYWTSMVSVRRLLEQAMQASGVKVNGAYATTISTSAYEMVKRGLGIGFIDPYTAAQLQDDRAVLLPFLPHIPFNVALLRPISRTAHAAVDDLLEIMKIERDRLLATLPS